MFALRLLVRTALVAMLAAAASAAAQESQIRDLLLGPLGPQPGDPSSQVDQPLAPVPEPAPPPELPEGWVWHELHGLRIGLPERFDRLPDDALNANPDAAGLAAYFGGTIRSGLFSRQGSTVIGLVFALPAEVAAGGRVTPDAVARAMAREAPFPVAATGETIPLLGQEFDVLQGEDRPLFGTSHELNVYLGRMVNSWGYLPMLTILHTDVRAREAEVLTARLLAALHPVGGEEIGLPELRDFADLVRVRVPPGGRWVGPGIIRFRDGLQGPLRAELLFQQLGPLDGAVLRFLDARFAELPGVTEGVAGDVPVWVLDGAARGVPGVETSGREAGASWQRRSLVTRLCPPGEGPVVLSAAIGPASPHGRGELLEYPTLTLPDDAGPCAERDMAPLQALFQGHPLPQAATLDEPSAAPSAALAPIREVVELMGGMIRLSVPENGRIRHEELLLSDAPDSAPHAAVRAGISGLTAEHVQAKLQDLFDGPVAAREAEVRGQPVWIVEGRAKYPPNSIHRTAEGDGWRRMALVTRLCPARFGPLIVAATTHEDRISDGLTLEALLDLAEIRLRGDAAPCPDEALQPLRSLVAATQE